MKDYLQCVLQELSYHPKKRSVIETRQQYSEVQYWNIQCIKQILILIWLGIHWLIETDHNDDLTWQHVKCHRTPKTRAVWAHFVVVDTWEHIMGQQMEPWVFRMWKQTFLSWQQQFNVPNTANTNTSEPMRTCKICNSYPSVLFQRYVRLRLSH